MNFNYKLSRSDFNTIIFALGILPGLELEDAPEQANLNQLCCMSAVHKLTNGDTKFTANEFRVISAAIQAVYLITRSELDVDSETKIECSRYVFDINRLMSVFDIDFDNLSGE